MSSFDPAMGSIVPRAGQPVAPGAVGCARVKSFDDLWVELSAKVAAADPASGTVAAVRGGVHAVGKKVVEEAAEAWMAAEHEGTERAAEEISQLLYQVQVLMLARGVRLDDVYARL
jgi:phosphoribosyl-ATP pyrophosphohydrolase